MTIRIVNKRDGIPGEYVGRPSPLGNPYLIGPDGTRKEVIEKYRVWFEDRAKHVINIRFQQELARMVQIYRDTGELTLVCWCAPEDCHARIIKEYIEAIVRETADDEYL